MNIEPIRKQAQDKDTPPEILAKLATSKDNLTRQYVADNPNTPERTLDYFSNDRDLLVRSNVAQNPSTSDRILSKIANSPTENKFIIEIANVVLDRRQAQNKNTSPERLAELAKSEDRITQKYVSSNPNTPQKILDYFANDRDLLIRDNVATNLSTSDRTLKKNANSSTEHISIVGVANDVLKRREIQNKARQAQDENTSPETLAKLAENKDWRYDKIRQYVAGNPNTPVDTLEKLAREFPAEIMINPILELLILENPSQLLRLKREVAKSPKTPLSILERLKDDRDCDVRLNIAVNPNTPYKILDSLIKESSKGFRRRLARKIDTPARVLDYLKNDTQTTVRAKLAYNPSTPVKTLDYLRNDEDMLVRRWVARNSSTPSNILEKIANSPTEVNYVSQMASFVLKRRQAQNQNTSPKVLAQLAERNQPKAIRADVAKNPNTSLDTLQELSNHTDEEITRLAKYNLEQRQNAIQQAQNENTSPAILARLANDRGKIVRQYVASNPNTALEILIKLSEEFPQEIIANPIMDLHILENPQNIFIQNIVRARRSTNSVETLKEITSVRDWISLGMFDG